MVHPTIGWKDEGLGFAWSGPLTMPPVRSPELSLSQPRALGLTSVCSLKSLKNKGCVSQSTPTVILSFGLTENRPSKSNKRTNGPPLRWDGDWQNSGLR